MDNSQIYYSLFMADVCLIGVRQKRGQSRMDNSETEQRSAKEAAQDKQNI
jgi:hypothetical protein